MPRPSTSPRARLILGAEITADGKLLRESSATPDLASIDTEADDRCDAWLYRGVSASLCWAEDGSRAPKCLARSVAGILGAELRLPDTYRTPAAWRRDVRALLRRAWSERPGNVLCFASAKRCRALLEHGLVDELKLIVVPTIDGHRETPSLSGPGVADFFPAVVSCHLLALETHGDRCLLHYRIVKHRSPARPAPE